MKKLFVLFIAGALLTGCGAESAEDINIEDLKTACDCVDAGNVIMTDILDAAGDKEENELEKDEAFMKKFEKMEALEKKCRKIAKKSEMKECDGWKDFEGTMKKFEEKF
jgi:hypothetical protein